jgi:hypothetical protein
MGKEENSLIEEINEELKNDQLLAFFKKHKNVIFTIVFVTVIGIIAHSSWHFRKNKQMEEITTALVNVLRSTTAKDEIIVVELLKKAPSELIPFLAIIKSGRKLYSGDEVQENLNALINLSKKNGLDVIWKDLALLVYASHHPKSSEELIKLLEPLTEDGHPFRFTAMEIIGMMHENDGFHNKALKSFTRITDSKGAPNSLKNRISILSAHIRDALEN